MCYLQIKMPNLAYFCKNKLDWGKGGLLIQSCLFLFLMATIAS